MISKIGYDIRKSQLGRKIRSAGHPVLPLYENRSITKKFPTKDVSKTIDSSIKGLEEFEYDK